MCLQAFGVGRLLSPLHLSVPGFYELCKGETNVVAVLAGAGRQPVQGGEYLVRFAQIVDPNVLYRFRAAQGVLGLRKKYGETRLEAACARAIAVGDPSYRTIKGILIAGTDSDPDPDPETSGDAGAAAFLHGPARLFATVATPDTTDDDHDDQVRDEAEVEAR